MDRKELETTASLAMLHLHEDEVETLTEAVTTMLDYFSLMGEVDVEGLSPTTHAFTARQSVREDIARETPVIAPEDLLSRGPEHDDEHFIIPNVL